jgi:hypothetical protein
VQEENTKSEEWFKVESYQVIRFLIPGVWMFGLNRPFGLNLFVRNEMVSDCADHEQEDDHPDRDAPCACALGFCVVKILTRDAGDLLSLTLGPQSFKEETKRVSKHPASPAGQDAGRTGFEATAIWAGTSVNRYGLAQEPIGDDGENASNRSDDNVNAERVCWIVLKKRSERTEKKAGGDRREENPHDVTKGATDGAGATGLRGGVDRGTLVKW